MNLKQIQWKGNTITVEYDLFQLIVKDWADNGWSKEEILDFIFEI